jgi:acyl-CoA synthetase (AMP-forming)/AMP-acid ligase II
MIKTSGYRVSPVEVEEVLYSTPCVGEAAAFGVPHPVLGQAIVAVITAKDGVPMDAGHALDQCRRRLPAYMIPAHLEVRTGPLPRNPNGKIDRKALASNFLNLFQNPTL